MKTIISLVLFFLSFEIYALPAEVASSESTSSGNAIVLASGQHKWVNNLCYEVTPAGSDTKIVAPNPGVNGDRYECGGEARTSEAVQAAYKEKLKVAFLSPDCARIIDRYGKWISAASSPTQAIGLKIAINALAMRGCPGY